MNLGDRKARSQSNEAEFKTRISVSTGFGSLEICSNLKFNGMENIKIVLS